MLGGAVVGATLSSHVGDWEPIELFFLLLVLAIGSDALAVEVGNVRVSGSFLAVVLAMALLGPAPAAVIGAGSTLVDAVYSRRVWQKGLNNLANWTAYPVVGGLLIALVYGDISPGNQDGLLFAAAVLVIFMITNFLNFAMVAGYNAATGEGSFSRACGPSISRCCPQTSPRGCSRPAWHIATTNSASVRWASRRWCCSSSST